MHRHEPPWNHTHGAALAIIEARSIRQNISSDQQVAEMAHASALHHGIALHRHDSVASVREPAHWNH